MSSFLTGTAHLLHTSPIPKGVLIEEAIAKLHDHEFLIRCDTHMSKFEPLKAEDGESTKDSGLPEGIEPLGPTSFYSVTDIVHTLPAGLWDSNVVSTWELTSLANGTFVRIRSPLSVVLDTIWSIRGGADGSLELVQDVTIRSPRLLVPVVKSQCANDWKPIHANTIAGITKKEPKTT
ncbi:hypothetical protein VTK73DRAFT_8265 [Phialemonium thermophilum]|uniref:DUF7053 domain-containing protein n=1 Tax=Phialemonium thermophilum TaxID=223376 RepID=A0ABR3W992_9PEZI